MENTRYLKACYSLARALDDASRLTWATSIKSLLYRYDYGIVWFQQGVGDINVFLTSFKQRIIDTCLQEWNDVVNSSSKLEFFHKIKDSVNMLQPEKYLLLRLNKKYKTALTRFRFFSVLMVTITFKSQAQPWAQPTLIYSCQTSSLDMFIPTQNNHYSG